MASTPMHTHETPAARASGEVSLVRLYMLRAAYLLIVVGLGATIVPEILSHPITDRGVIAALLGGVWALAILGLRYPLRMLPLLMFELVWKTIWMIAYGLPQWMAGVDSPRFSEDLVAIGAGPILFAIIIPWGYVYRHYIRRPADRWR